MFTIKTLGEKDKVYIGQTFEEHSWFAEEIFKAVERALGQKSTGFHIFCPWCQMEVQRFRVTRKGCIYHHYERCLPRILEQERQINQRNEQSFIKVCSVSALKFNERLKLNERS